MLNLDPKMLFFLYFTALLATGNCFVSPWVDQPLKLAMSLFGGQREQNAQMTSPMQMTPVAAPHPMVPSAPTMDANRHGDSSPKLRPLQSQPTQPWRDSSSSLHQQSEYSPNGPEPSRDDRGSGGYHPVESWHSQHQSTGPSKDQDQPEAYGDYKNKPRVESYNGGSWTGQHHSVETHKEVSLAGGARYTGSERYREMPHVNPSKHDSSENPAEPWKLYRPKPIVPGRYRPRLQLPSTDYDSQERINKLWEEEKRISHHTPKQDRQRPRIEPLNDDEPANAHWGIDHKSWSALRIVPGREHDNYGVWNKRMRSELSLKKAGNIVPIISMAPLQEVLRNDAHVSVRRRNGGGEPIEMIRRRQDDSDEQVDEHIIHGRMESEASARRPIDSLEDIPGLRSNIVIITAKPLVSRAHRNYHRSARYMNGVKERPKETAPSTEEDCIFCF